MATLTEQCDWLSTQLVRPPERVEICQCRTESIISRSKDSARTRAVLLTYVFIDQLIFSHFNFLHERFKEQYIGPKLRQHSFGGHASPSWFVYPSRVYDEKADWNTINEVFSAGLRECLEWVQGIEPIDEDYYWRLVNEEVKSEFELHHHNKLLFG